MIKDIRMIALDMDGTTLNSLGELTPRVSAAISKAIDKGIVVLPATGRQLTGIPAPVFTIPGIRYVVSANGALVVDRAKNKVLHTDYLPCAQALEILRLLQQYNGMPGVYIEGVGYAESEQLEAFTAHLKPGLADYFRTTRTLVPSLEKLLLETKKDVEKVTILFLDDQERTRAYQALQQQYDDICVTSSMALNLEINTITANKGAGLVALGKLLGITSGQMMAIGDSSNDIAMGNATAEVKPVARTVTGTNDEDGVATAIEAVL